ncbi:hypothetical protein BC628DRAFT_1064824 [Trametes gibbosa]|nr:hypothetical protein BC628DRAFT_1064824 [Trametes gibbosa]
MRLGKFDSRYMYKYSHQQNKLPWHALDRDPTSRLASYRRPLLFPPPGSSLPAPVPSSSKQCELQQNIHMKHIILDHRKHTPQHCKPTLVATRHRLQHRSDSGHSCRCPARHGLILVVCLSVCRVRIRVHRASPIAVWHTNNDEIRQRWTGDVGAALVLGCHRDHGRGRGESRPLLDLTVLVLVLRGRLLVISSLVLLLGLNDHRRRGKNRLGWYKGLRLDDDQRSIAGSLSLFEFLELGGLLLLLKQLLLTLLAL